RTPGYSGTGPRAGGGPHDARSARMDSVAARIERLRTFRRRARQRSRSRPRPPVSALARAEREDLVAEAPRLLLAHVDLGRHVDARGEALEPVGLHLLRVAAALHDADAPPHVVLRRHAHVIAGDREDLVVEARHASASSPLRGLRGRPGRLLGRRRVELEGLLVLSARVLAEELDGGDHALEAVRELADLVRRRDRE